MLPSRRADSSWKRGATRIALFFQIKAATNVLINDVTSTPDQLLGTVLGHQDSGGRDPTASPWAGQSAMEENWSTVIFGVFYPAFVQSLCFDNSEHHSWSSCLQAASQHSRLPSKSFVIRLFGLGASPSSESRSLTCLKDASASIFQPCLFFSRHFVCFLPRTANLALKIENHAPHDLLRPRAASVPSAFPIAPDTVSRVITFSILMAL